MPTLDDLQRQIAGLQAQINELQRTKMAVSSTGSTSAYDNGGLFYFDGPFGGLFLLSPTDTYDPADGTGTYQIKWSFADGKEYAGGGNVVLDSDGVQIEYGPNAWNGIQWMDGATQLSNIWTDIIAGAVTMYLQASGGTYQCQVTIDTDAKTITIAPNVSGIYGNGIIKLQGDVSVNGAILDHTNALGIDGYLELRSRADPSAPSANQSVIFAELVGGKMKLYAKFPSGGAQLIASEP